MRVTVTGNTRFRRGRGWFAQQLILQLEEIHYDEVEDELGRLRAEVSYCWRDARADELRMLRHRPARVPQFCVEEGG